MVVKTEAIRCANVCTCSLPIQQLLQRAAAYTTRHMRVAQQNGAAAFQAVEIGHWHSLQNSGSQQYGVGTADFQQAGGGRGLRQAGGSYVADTGCGNERSLARSIMSR